MRNLLRNKRLVGMLLVALLAVLGGYLLLIPDGDQRGKPITVERAKVAMPDKKGAESPQPKSVAEIVVQREPVGSVTQFKGLAYASFESVKRTLAEGAALFPGDQIVTGKDTRLIMKMRDDAVIALGPESEFQIQEYRFEPEEESGNGVVNMTKGMVRFTSGKLAKMKDQPFKVVTPVATLGVRGTEGFVRLGDGKGKDREIEVVTLQKELLVWMEEMARPGPKASSGELFFSKSWSLINDAWAADTSKAPLAVRHGERLVGSANKAPEVRKATREELRGAYATTAVRKLSDQAKKKLTDQVAKSLVDKGLAPDKATAEAMLKKAPQALDELVSKAEEKLEKELEKAIDKKLEADEKIAKLDDKLKETLGAETSAKIQEIERRQEAQLETVRQERSEKIQEIVTNAEMKQASNEILAGHDEKQAELRAELGERIAKAESQSDTKKLTELKTELKNKLAELEKETQKSLESLLGAEQTAKVQEAVQAATNREAEIVQERAKQIESAVPKEQQELVRSIERQKEQIQIASPLNLSDLSQSPSTGKAQEQALQTIEAATTSLVNGIADAVKAGVPLDKVIQGLQDAAVERQRNEAARLGVDLDTAAKNADEFLKLLEKSPFLPKKDTESEKSKGATKPEETAKPAEPTAPPPADAKKGDDAPKATTTAPVAPTATTTIPGIAPSPMDAAGSLSSSGFSSTTTTTTTITINNAPTISMQTFAIDENAPTGTVVGTVVASDPDVADQDKLKFSLSDNFGGAFGMDENTGKLTVLDSSKLDFETNPSIRLTAVVKDTPKTGSASATIWVVLTDVNEAPTVTSGGSGILAENATETVYTATAFDQDKDDTFTWSLAGTDAGFFRIDATSGVVTFRNPPDFENANHAPAYVIDVIATDKKGVQGSKTVTITVTDVNEAPTITSEAGVLFVENGAGIAYQATATDPDAADKNKLTWSLSGNDAALFEINAQTGAVRFLAKPDFESPKDVGGDNLYNFTVTVTDTGWQGTSAQSDAKAVTITVIDQSTVSVTSSESVNFDENATGIAYQATATEPDPGDDPRIWSLLGADAALFNIEAATGAVRFKQAPDYENPQDHGKQNSYHITIQVSDKNKFFASKAVTINVIDLNEGPVIAATAPSAVNFAENGTGTAYQAPATDPDKNDILTWSLGGADEALFSIHADTGAVTFRLPPDFESTTHAPVYALTVKVQDKGGLTDSKAVTITVTDVNEPPVVTSGSSATFVENGTGVVYTATAIDPDANDLFGWSVGGADKNRFTIDPTTGELRFKTAPDFESTTHGPVYVIDVIAMDRAGQAGSKSVTITVTDQPPVITSVPNASFAENGTGIAYQATATALDAGDGTRVWALSGLDAARFTIDASGAVRFATPPDFESPSDVGRDNVYEINVTVTDKGTLSDSRAVSITVTDVNEAPKISATAPSEVTFAENGTGVAYQTTAFDPDFGDELTWSLSGADALLFTMDAKTGAVRFNNPPDFENPRGPAHAITVVVTDKLGLSDSKPVTVTVTNVNEKPLIDPAAPASVTFNENASGPVYQTTATDPEGDILTWSLTGADAALFAINPTSGAVTFLTPPDFESPHGPAYAITVVATDTGALFDTKAVTVTVLNVNEAPKIDPAALSAVSVVENSTGSFYQITATDVDVPDTLTWSLAGSDAALFAINPTTGAVAFLTPPDFESPHGPTYAITVVVTDMLGLSDNKPVTVTVVDVNEAPVITSAAGVNFAENGTGVAYSATAVDADANDGVTWSLSGADAALFTLDPTTGAVRFAISPDFENPKDVGKNNVYDIVVTATDKAGLFSALNVAITVTDVIESPSITSGPSATFPENGTGIAYQATAAPPELGDVLTWSIGGADSGRFAIDPSTGAVTFVASPDFETALDVGVDNVYNINVIVTNKLNLSDTKAVTITVTNVNEAPKIDPAALASVNFVENGTGVAYQTTASDPDAGESLTWSLGGADVGLFNIDPATGAVTFKVAPDFESTTHAPTHALTLTVTDRDGLFDSKPVTIVVTNANEKPTIDPSAPATKDFAENGTGVAYQTTATDPDVGEVLTWSLTGADAALFAIDPTSGAVTFLAPPDFESLIHTPAYAITLVVTDSGGLLDTKAVTINVTNVNEAPVIDPLASATASFVENATGTVYQTTATDPDV
ncbi:MAG: cadherin domain-containing protein, partial [Magnetococcales bacterium]|nr:cadherin domain-containing protein [Magnetococcales bacterium]